MPQLNTSLESALALDDEGGHWVTINSVHVHVKGGMIDQGPAHIEGKSLEQAAKEGYPVTAIHGAEKPTGAQYTPEQFKQLRTRIKKIMDEGAQKYAYVSHSKALAQAKKEMGLSDTSYILQLSDIGEGKAVPLVLEGFPATNAAGKPIYYRKMKVAEIGDWTNRSNGDPLPIPASRADEWIRNVAALAAAGIRPFVTTKHVYDELGNFTAPDARDTLGYVERMERDEKNVYSIVSLHGDESLDVAAKNNRSIGVGRRDSIDDKGNVYAGETLHHLAMVPNPALTGLGDMTRIAASADGAAYSAPVYELSQPSSQTAASGRKGSRMNKEIAQKVRAALSLSADAVPDERLDDTVAERALSLSDDVARLTTERDSAKNEAAAKASEILSLSADKREPDSLSLSLITKAFKTERDQVIASGVISQAGMEEIDKLLYSGGKPTRTALALSADSTDPFYSRLMEILKRFPGIKTNNQKPADATEAKPVIALSDDAGSTPEAQKALRDRVKNRMQPAPAH